MGIKKALVDILKYPVEARISRVQEELKLVKSPLESNIEDVNSSSEKLSEARYQVKKTSSKHQITKKL